MAASRQSAALPGISDGIAWLKAWALSKIRRVQIQIIIFNMACRIKQSRRSGNCNVSSDRQTYSDFFELLQLVRSVGATVFAAGGNLAVECVASSSSRYIRSMRPKALEYSALFQWACRIRLSAIKISIKIAQYWPHLLNSRRIL